MNETYVTIVGHLGTAPEMREVGDSQVAQFRLASTPRVYSAREGAWVNKETNWYTVNAWRALAGNAASSLKAGDPVVVHGRLTAQTWGEEGQRRTTMVIEAVSIGHDLARGTSAFLKTLREQAPQTEDERALAESNARLEATTGLADPSVPLLEAAS